MITNVSKFRIAGCWAAARAWLVMSLFLAGCHAGGSDPRFSDLPGVTTPATPATAPAATPAETPAVATPGAPINSATTVVMPLPPVSASASNAEKLKVGDTLTIVFSDLPYIQPPFEGPIKEDGSITLMQNQEFRAAGKTPGELEKEIRHRYVPDYFLNMTVTVTPKEMTRFYYVGGEVKVPGREPYIGPITLLRAIETAGDFTDFAKRTKVELTRAGSTNKVTVIDCVKARTDPSLDVEIFPGDKIHVRRRLF